MTRLISTILFFICAHSAILAQRISIDPEFNTDFDFKSNAFISAVAVQEDGKIIVGGFFEVPFLLGNKLRNIVRLNKDGSIDDEFKIGEGCQGGVWSIVIQADKKILVAGEFQLFNNKKVDGLVRLNMDGTFDTSFAQTSFKNASSAALQKDNKIIVCANSLTVMRLMPNGERDLTFNEKVVNQAGGVIWLLVQPDDKIIVKGSFKVNKNSQNKNITRLKPNGDLDSVFEQNQLDLRGNFECIEPLENGTTLLGGTFKSYKPGVNINTLLRFNADGSIDDGFKPLPGFVAMNGFTISAITTQKDGKIILGGQFQTFAGRKNNGIVRLFENGDIDTTFEIGGGFADRKVTFLKVYKENKLLVAGNFLSYDTRLANMITRLIIKSDTVINNDTLPLNGEKIFLLYPNPTKGKFRISSPQEIKAIVIYDALGREIFKTEIPALDHDIDIGKEAEGVYFIKAWLGNETKILKFLKQ